MLNNMVKELLDEVGNQEKKYGGNIFEKIKKTNEEEINNFKIWFSKYSKININEYIDFVKYLNGLNFNGLFLYSLDKNCEYNIFDSNETWWENDEQKEYVFFGDDNGNITDRRRCRRKNG